MGHQSPELQTAECNTPNTSKVMHTHTDTPFLQHQIFANLTTSNTQALKSRTHSKAHNILLAAKEHIMEVTGSELHMHIISLSIKCYYHDLTVWYIRLFQHCSTAHGTAMTRQCWQACNELHMIWAKGIWLHSDEKPSLYTREPLTTGEQTNF